MNGPEVSQAPRDLGRLAFPHEPGVDVHEVHAPGVQACKQERGHHARIHSARNEENHVPLSDLILQSLLLPREKHFDAPFRASLADVHREGLEDLLAMLAVARLGVELHAPHATGLIDKGRGKPVLRLPDDAETRGSFRDRVPVTHPRHEGVPGNAREELRLFLQQYAGPAVLLAAEGGHGPAVIRAHALEAIADPQHGEAFFIDALVRARGAFLIHGERGTREDDAADVAEIDAGERRVTGHDPAEYAELPNPASDELRALASKVENQDSVHQTASSFRIRKHTWAYFSAKDLACSAAAPR